MERCYRCMKETNSFPCTGCGYDPSTAEQDNSALKPGSIVGGHFLVGTLIGRGGFGMTYAGFDTSLQRKVAVKEYYPSGYVKRTPGSSVLHWSELEAAKDLHRYGLEAVIKEARKMARIADVPESVNVLGTFQENETAYIVMDYVEGETLKQFLRRRGLMNWQDIRRYFFPAIQAMGQIHARGIIHRDISPDNIMIQPNGAVRILDLGAAKDLKTNSGFSSQLVHKPCFSPWEQYTERGKSGPWTDVYAMAATMWYCIAGELIPEALKRFPDDCLNTANPALDKLPSHAKQALFHALAVRADQRTPSMEAFLSELSGQNTRCLLDYETVAAQFALAAEDSIPDTQPVPLAAGPTASPERQPDMIGFTEAIVQDAKSFLEDISSESHAPIRDPALQMKKTRAGKQRSGEKNIIPVLLGILAVLLLLFLILLFIARISA